MTTSQKRAHIGSQSEDDEKGTSDSERATFRQDSKKWIDYAAYKAKVAFGQSKDRFIEELGDVAGVMREGAAQLEETDRVSAPYIEDGAERVERMRDSLQQRDAEDLIEELSAFAKRYPRSFLLGSTLAGFSLMRLLRSVDYRTVEVLDTKDEAVGTRVAEPRESATRPS